MFYIDCFQVYFHLLLFIAFSLSQYFVVVTFHLIISCYVFPSSMPTLIWCLRSRHTLPSSDPTCGYVIVVAYVVGSLTYFVSITCSCEGHCALFSSRLGTSIRFISLDSLREIIVLSLMKLKFFWIYISNCCCWFCLLLLLRWLLSRESLRNKLFMWGLIAQLFSFNCFVLSIVTILMPKMSGVIL